MIHSWSLVKQGQNIYLPKNRQDLVRAVRAALHELMPLKVNSKELFSNPYFTSVLLLRRVLGNSSGDSTLFLSINHAAVLQIIQEITFHRRRNWEYAVGHMSKAKKAEKDRISKPNDELKVERNLK